MKKNKPRTIADLKFDWTITREAHEDIGKARKKILDKNPHLEKLKIVKNDYVFLIDSLTFELSILDTSVSLKKVLYFFEYLCFVLNHSYSITGTFSHFERIDDQTYRIHMKKKS